MKEVKITYKDKRGNEWVIGKFPKSNLPFSNKNKWYSICHALHISDYAPTKKQIMSFISQIEKI